MNNISYTILKLTNRTRYNLWNGSVWYRIIWGSKPTSNYYHQTGYIQRCARGNKINKMVTSFYRTKLFLNFCEFSRDNGWGLHLACLSTMSICLNRTDDSSWYSYRTIRWRLRGTFGRGRREVSRIRKSI